MRLSLLAGERTRAALGPLSLADALMAPMPGAIPFLLAKSLGVTGLAVSDADLQRGVSFAARHLKLMIEPGGAAGLAALLSGKFATRNKAIAVVLSGGNCEPATVAQCCAAVTDP